MISREKMLQHSIIMLVIAILSAGLSAFTLQFVINNFTNIITREDKHLILFSLIGFNFVYTFIFKTIAWRIEKHVKK